MGEEEVRHEELHVSGDELADKVQEALHEGSVRRVIIRREDGGTVLELSLTWAIVVAIVAPQLAALGAILALVKNWSIIVERVEG